MTIEDDAVYPPLLHRAEVLVADALAALANRPKLKQPLKTHDHTLSDTQRSAVDASLGTHLLVLTGGPGTGKTTTVRAIVQAHAALDRRVALCAPTGTGRQAACPRRQASRPRPFTASSNGTPPPGTSTATRACRSTLI